MRLPEPQRRQIYSTQFLCEATLVWNQSSEDARHSIHGQIRLSQKVKKIVDAGNPEMKTTCIQQVRQRL